MTMYTIGHSNHPIQTFLDFLHRFHIQLLVDVRSNPYSRYHPQFNYDVFKISVNNENVIYHYGGDKIGGNYSDNNLQFTDGGVDYSKVECSQKFSQGIDHLIQLGVKHTNVVIMCAENDPFFCHRFGLISHALSKKNIITEHILPKEKDTLTNVELENKMRSAYGEMYSLDELYVHHNWIMFHTR